MLCIYHHWNAFNIQFQESPTEKWKASKGAIKKLERPQWYC